MIEADEHLGVASISAWELGMLHRLGRSELDRPVAAWLAEALGRSGIDEVPLTAALVTKDVRLREFDPAGTVW